jgi:hypothetical protein
MANNLRFLDEDGKRRALETQRKTLSRQDAILISEKGAGILVQSERSKFVGLSIPRGTLPEGQRKAFVDSIVARHPNASVESVELLVESATPGLLARIRDGAALLTVTLFVHAGDGVILGHLGTPDDPTEGMAGFQRLIQAFRFDTTSARPTSTPSERAPSGRIQLPADARVVVPGHTVSRGLAAYSGRWAGWWNDQIEHVLLVEQITQTTAVLVYAVVGRTGPTWSRYRASVVDGTLRVKTGNHVLTYRLNADDTLLATQESAAVILRARLRRAQ